MERIEGLVAEGRALVAAFRQHAAFHDGKTLGREYANWQSGLRLAPGTTEATITDADDATIAYIVRRWPRRPVEVS